jgi:hypothetical protein
LPQIPYREGASFVKLPTSTPILTKVIQATYQTEKNPFFGKVDQKGKKDERENREVIKVILEAVEEEFWGAKIWKTFGASIHEQSALRPFINASSAKDLTTDELKAFNTDTLLGRYVSVAGTYGENDPEQKFLKPTGFFRASKASIATAEVLIASKLAAASASPARASSPAREPVAAAAGANEIDF